MIKNPAKPPIRIGAEAVVKGKARIQFARITVLLTLEIFPIREHSFWV